MKGKKIAGICLGAVLACGSVFGMSACQKDDRDPQIVEVYNMYVAYAEAKGETPKTYEEWLESIKGDKGEQGLKGEPGEPGEQGKSAYEIWKEAGNEGSEEDFLNWLKGEVGEQGKSAYEIWKDAGNEGSEEDFLNWLKGEPGEPGEPGKPGEPARRGNRITKGEGKPPVDSQDDPLYTGDLYIDTTTYELYFYQESTEYGVPSRWINLGSLKGPQGPIGPQGPAGSGTADPSTVTVSIEAGSTQDISIADFKAGTYIMEFDLGATKLDKGEIYVQVGENARSRIIFSQPRTDEADGHNIYYGYLIVTKGAKTATVSAVNESFAANVKITEWEMPTLEAGKPIEVPVNVSGTSLADCLKFKIAEGLSGKYNFEVSNYGNSRVYHAQLYMSSNESKEKVWIMSYEMPWSAEITDTDYVKDGDTFGYLIMSNTAIKYLTAITLTITLAE